MGIEVKGMDEMAERIRQLIEKPNKILKQCAELGASVIRDDAEKRARRSTASKEHLQDHVLVKKAVAHRDGTVTARVGITKEFAYAIPLEKGHIIRTNKGYKKVAARPFLSPAFDAKEREAQIEMAYFLEKELLKRGH